MNYSRHYNQLIERAWCRILSGYKEEHHIRPRCLGGNGNSENMVCLTPEEHFVAHQLLMKMYPKNIKLLWATINMTAGNGKQKRNNKLYGWLRRKLADRLRVRRHSEESKRKMSENHNYNSNPKGAKRSNETKRKMSLAKKGKLLSPEHRKALSRAQMGRKWPPRSEGHKQKIQEGMRRKMANRENWNSGFFDTPEYKNKQSEIMKQIWAERKEGNLPIPIYGEGNVCRIK